MKHITEAWAIELLKKHAPDSKRFDIIFKHVKKVQEIAIKIASEIIKNGHTVNIDFIKAASILHDIGRYKHPPGSANIIKHGVDGANILRAEGLDEAYARVCENHIGSGINANDIKKQNLNIPEKDYMPQTIEEKIINYADSLTFYDKQGTIEMVIERYQKEVGSEIAQRTRNLHNEIEKLRNK